MKVTITCLLVILLMFRFVSLMAQPEAPNGKVWEKIPGLSDEFDTWDDSKWQKSLWNYGEPVQMRAENSGVDNGKLWIKATLDEGATRWFETSRVMSKEKVNYPMYTECSMKTAHISAYNTYWLNNGDSKNRDEFDICENNSKASIESQREERKYTMMSQYFLVVDNDVERNKGDFDNRNLSSENPLRGVAWNEAYHTLGAYWIDAHRIQFYLNGEPAGRVQTQRAFTRDLYVIWDLWTIAADWAGGIADQNDLLNDSINTMYIDWVHTYQLEDDESLDNKAHSSKIRVFPNPANDFIKINLDGNLDRNASVHIYDSLGAVVRTESLLNNDVEVSLNGLSKGIYLVKVSNNNSVATQSIVKL